MAWNHRSAQRPMIRTRRRRSIGRMPVGIPRRHLLQKGAPMNWTLEVVVVPVTDVDRAKAFYSEQLGFNVDVDNRMGESFRNVQLTPAGSGCSVTIGTGLTPGLQLCVSDIGAAHEELDARG